MPFIKRSFVDKIYEEANVVQIIGTYQDLKKKGTTYECLSPITKEKTPSFKVSPVKNIWKDFSSGEGGNAIKYLQRVEGLSFPEAIETAAKIMNLEVEYEEINYSDAEKEAFEHKNKLYKLINQVAEAYHQEFLKLPKNHPAHIEVYKKRKYTDVEVKKWLIGYAPGKGFLREVLKEKALLKEGREIGLIRDNYDFFQNRLLIPIRKLKSYGYQTIAFGGRALDEEGMKYGKWINSPDSNIYHKEQEVYGLHEALPGICKEGFAIKVEGYNDPISLDRIGINNAIANCGTSFSENQIRLIKRRTDRIALFLDGDQAAIDSAIKDVKMCIKHKLSVKVIDLFKTQRKKYTAEKILPEANRKATKMDPDEWARKQFSKYADIDSNHRELYNKIEKESREGFIWLSEKLLDGITDTYAKSKVLSELAEILNHIDDDFTKSMYVNQLNSSVSGITKDQLTREIARQKQILSQKEWPKSAINNDEYTMPKGLEDLFDKYHSCIRKNKLFFHKNVMYSRRGKEGEYRFQDVSNFSIRIIQHINDHDFPKKIVELKNTDNKHIIFDTPAEDFVSEGSFMKMLIKKGNFDWRGSGHDFIHLRTKLLSEMGEGRLIDGLGWQPEGFWAFCNKIVSPEGVKAVDENGIVEYKGVSYYIPPGNKIYAHTNDFQDEKKVRYILSDLSMKDVLKQIYTVFGDHAISALLFTMATIYSDFIFKKNRSFPLLFLEGSGGTGKDSLIQACQSFFGEYQGAVEMTGSANTDKGVIRFFHQFNNMMCNLSEYNNGYKEADKMLKASWERKGYVMGNLKSKRSMDRVPVTNTIIFTGNYYPTEEAIIQRFIAVSMNKSEFSKEERAEFRKLSAMMETGYSHLIEVFIKHRNKIEYEWDDKYKESFYAVSQYCFGLSVTDRMIKNAAALGTIYQILMNDIDFPFDWNDILMHFKTCYEAQTLKRDTGSVTSTFWRSFYDVLCNDKRSIEYGVDYKSDGDQIAIRFRTVYRETTRSWFELEREKIPAIGTMREKLKNSPEFIKSDGSYKFGNYETSALIFDLKKIDNGSDINQKLI